jgi:hypothetical protein
MSHFISLERRREEKGKQVIERERGFLLALQFWVHLNFVGGK